MRTDLITLYGIVHNRNLQGLPRHLNGYPRVSAQNFPPQNMVWRTREASRPPETHSGRTTDSTPARLPSTESTAPDPTPKKKEGGCGARDYICVYTHTLSLSLSLSLSFSLINAYMRTDPLSSPYHPVPLQWS